MPAPSNASEFRVAKRRAKATLTLSSGQTLRGCFFVAGGSPHHVGHERVADVLNAEAGFFPFEVDDAERIYTALLHRNHVVMAGLAEHEARQEPGYIVATRREVSLLLSNGRRVEGAVRVYRPREHDRLSDWAHHGGRFRYLETPTETLVVNIDHVVEAREVPEA